MNPSIRKYLLINLLLGVTIVILLSAIVNYYLAQQDIERHLDMLLSQSAYAIQALFSDGYEHRNLKKVQNAIQSLPAHIETTMLKYHHHSPYPYQNTFEFQVWNDKHELLLKTNNTPEFPISDYPAGYSFKNIDNTPWRTFILHDPKTNLSIIVAERFNSRYAFGRSISNDYLMTILFAYPLLGLLIWSIVGRGLGSLKRVTYEVSHRAPNYLEPVDIKFVPYEIKPLVDELNQLFIRLHQAFEREKRFASDAAHELRTPLAALKTHAQLALKENSAPERSIALKKLITGVDRSTHIVEQLLTLSRLVPEASTLTDVCDFNLPNVAADILADLAPSALSKQIDLELNVEESNLKITGNPTAIGILLQNLVDNAIRYIHEGGKITVDIFKRQEQTVMRVEDNGPGVPQELHDRIFERFYRVLGNKSPGSGLGLAIVLQISNLHQSEISLSAPQQGTGLIVEIMFPKRYTPKSE